ARLAAGGDAVRGRLVRGGKAGGRVWGADARGVGGWRGGEPAADEDPDHVRPARGVLRAGTDAERLDGHHRLRARRGGEAAQERDAGGGRELADAGSDPGRDAPSAVLVRTALRMRGQGRVRVGGG